MTFKQKLDAERERLSTVQTASIRGPHEQDLFCMGWDQAVDTVLRLLREDTKFDREAAYKRVKEGFPSAPYPSEDYFVRGAEWKHQTTRPIIAALKAELSFRHDSAISIMKSMEENAANLYVENKRLKEALEEISKGIGHIPACTGKELDYCDAGCEFIIAAKEALKGGAE